MRKIKKFFYKEIYYKRKIGKKFYWFVKYQRIYKRQKYRKHVYKVKKRVIDKLKEGIVLSKDYIRYIYNNTKVYSLYYEKYVPISKLEIERFSYPKYFNLKTKFFSDKKKLNIEKTNIIYFTCLVLVHVSTSVINKKRRKRNKKVDYIKEKVYVHEQRYKIPRKSLHLLSQERFLKERFKEISKLLGYSDYRTVYVQKTTKTNIELLPILKTYILGYRID